MFAYSETQFIPQFQKWVTKIYEKLQLKFLIFRLLKRVNIRYECSNSDKINWNRKLNVGREREREGEWERENERGIEGENEKESEWDDRERLIGERERENENENEKARGRGVENEKESDWDDRERLIYEREIVGGGERESEREKLKWKWYKVFKIYLNDIVNFVHNITFVHILYLKLF